MILYREHADWTYTIEWWPEGKYVTIVYNKADDKPRTSTKYESQYEAEVLVLQTIADLARWYPQ